MTPVTCAACLNDDKCSVQLWQRCVNMSGERDSDGGADVRIGPTFHSMHWADKQLQMVGKVISGTYLSSSCNKSRNKFLPNPLSYCKFCSNLQVLRNINSRHAITYPVLHVLPKISVWFDWPHTQLTVWRTEQFAPDGRATLWLRSVRTKCMSLCLFIVADSELLLY